MSFFMTKTMYFYDSQLTVHHLNLLPLIHAKNFNFLFKTVNCFIVKDPRPPKNDGQILITNFPTEPVSGAR